MPQHQVYGLDIEVGSPESATDVIDPSRIPINRVALSTGHDEYLFEGTEESILLRVDATLARLEPGILATWNGSGFDLPYLADRAESRAIRLGLHLAADPRLGLRGEILRGHASAYRAAWYAHRHLDAARIYRSGRRPLIDVDDLLEAVGWRRWGHRVEGPADASLSHEAAHAFAPNDAKLVRTMVQQRLPAILRRVDRIHIEPLESAPAEPLRHPGRVPHSAAHPAVRALLANRP